MYTLVLLKCIQITRKTTEKRYIIIFKKNDDKLSTSQAIIIFQHFQCQIVFSTKICVESATLAKVCLILESMH